MTGFFAVVVIILLVATAAELWRRLRLASRAAGDLRDALAASERRARDNYAQLGLMATIFEHSPVAISVMDSEGNFEAVNPAFTKARGYTAEEVRGKSPQLLFGTTESGTNRAGILRALQRDGHWEGEYMSRRKDGSEILAWASISLVRDGQGRIVNRVTVSVDIGERRAAEAQMLLLAKAFDVAAGPIFIADADNRVIAVNPAFTQATGFTPKMVVGQHIGILHDPATVAMLPAVIAGLNIRGSWEGEIRRRRADGSSFPTFSSSARGFDEDGKTLFLVVSFIDLTEAKEAEARSEMFRLLAEHAGQGIALAHPDGTLIFQNRAERVLLGVPDDVAVEANKVNRYYTEAAFDQIRREVDPVVQAEGQWMGELPMLTYDGREIPTFHNLFKVRDNTGELRGYGHVIVDLSERKATEEQIRKLAHHDALTGLLNRHSLHGRLEQAVGDAKRAEDRVCLLFIDMDRFKLINDTLGHAVGDLLLCEVGRRLTEHVRESDIVARLGGDEFVVVLTGIHSAENTARQAEKVLTSLAAPYSIGGHELHSTPSIGVALFPEDGGTPDELMKSADTAMYQAKAGGRNNFRFFTPSMNDAANERLMLEHSMRQGLARGEFLLHYQPQIEAASGRTIGFEALVRWLHPQHGMIAPGRFIPVAEETGMIVELGAWVLQEALRELRRWREAGHRPVRMAVNISAAQLRTPGFTALVAAALTENGLTAADLELEITESVAMQHPEETVRMLATLREMGVDLAIDDFGTGYSSLSYLKLLPIQRLKLDQSFVRDLEEDSNDAAICTATIALAHSLGLGVVAEGVETEGQYAFLNRLGTDVLQGYLFGRPMEGAAAAQAIEARPCLRLAG